MDAASVVTLTVTMQLPEKDVQDAIRALCLLNPNGHVLNPVNDFVRCITNTRSMSCDDARQGGFFGPMIEALETLYPGAIAAHRQWQTARAKFPWSLECFMEIKDEPYWHPHKSVWHPFETPTGTWCAHMRIRFPRTAEGRDTLERYPGERRSEWEPTRDTHSLDPVTFAQTYVRPFAQAATLAAQQQEPGSKNHVVVARHAEWLTDIATLIETSAQSPHERAQLTVLLDGDKATDRRYEPVL